MKKLLFIVNCSLLIAFAVANVHAAVAIKRAEPVATNESAGTGGGGSLVPSLLGLVGGVMELNKQQNALTQECIPSSAEITFVDNAMKEWAKTGQMTAAQVRTLLRREPCGVSSPDARGYSDCYSVDVMLGVTPGIVPRYNVFSGPGNHNMVWANFPKVGKGTYCKDGTTTCVTRDQTTVSDMYDLFNIIDFGPADYLPTEASLAARLLNKMETCSPAILSAKKKQMWGEFLTDTAANIGQPTNTGTIMETISGVVRDGPAGGIGSIGAVATQFLNK